MLKLILGRAKSGKTTAIMEEIRTLCQSGEEDILMLVPEQYSHEAERELLRFCGDSLSLHGRVLSFTRLSQTVESALGLGGEGCLNKGGRLLCLSLALEETGSRLKVYSGARRRSEMQLGLLDAIDELKTSLISPEMLMEAAENRCDGLGDKLRDMALIYGAFDAISNNSRLDPMDRLTRLAENIGDFVKPGQKIYVDGFLDFTKQQLEVLHGMLKSDAELTVCLSCESLSESHEIFEPSRKSAAALQRIAVSLGIDCVLTTVQKPTVNSPMAVLERELFSFGSNTFDSEGRISLHSAESIAAECEFAAARCLELVRKTGCRFRDIAVASRAYGDYAGTLRSVFNSYGIPLYSAVKDPVMAKPIPSLIQGAFEVIGGGFGYDDVFSYLKTGLCGISAEECDELENYVFLWSLRGKAWTADENWRLHPDGFDREYTEDTNLRLDRINYIRRKASLPLLRLMEAGKEARTAAEQAVALSRFFEDISLPETLEKRAGELRARGMEKTAAEYLQLWEITVDALEQCCAILGSAEMDMETFGKLFCLVLSRYDVGTIPLTLDSVSAGDMDRMRRRNIKHLIVLGCDSQSIPMISEDSGVFTEDDRRKMADLGLDIGNTAEEKLSLEFSLAYNCITLPSETLAVSFCSGGDGEMKQPGFIMTRLKDIFSLEIQQTNTEKCRMSAPSPAMALAACSEKPKPKPLYTAARQCLEEMGFGERLGSLQRAASLSRGRLSRSAVRALYGDKLRLSASRVDKFSSCKFSYFLQYGLKAKPRKPAGFQPPEMGTFMHFVLEGVSAEIAASGGFKKADESYVSALCDKYVEKYISERLNNFREKSQRFVYLFSRLTKSVRRIVLDIVSELSKGDFVPLDFELDFGSSGAFPPINVGEGDTALQLTGIADRVDGYYHDGKLCVRVVDYKTGTKKFSLSDVWYGMGLQMLLYLFALQKAGDRRYGSQIVPAGILYVPARDVLVSAKARLSDEEILKEKAKALRRSGLVLDDSEILQAMERGEMPEYIPVKLKDGSYSGDSLASLELMGALSRHIDEILQEMASQLHNGSIAADPYFFGMTESACLFCDYAAACQFDENCDKRRYLPKLKASQVKEKLLGGEN